MTPKTQGQLDYANEYMKGWQKRNKDKVNAKNLKWNKENPGRRKQIRDNWKKTHPFQVSKARAERRGHVWALTKEEYEWITKSSCFYCDGALPTYYGGLDRIDNSLGYTLHNVLPSCTSCNISRNDFYSVEEMKIMQLALKDFRNKKVA